MRNISFLPYFLSVPGYQQINILMHWYIISKCILYKYIHNTKPNNHLVKMQNRMQLTSEFTHHSAFTYSWGSLRPLFLVKGLSWTIYILRNNWWEYMRVYPSMREMQQLNNNNRISLSLYRNAFEYKLRMTWWWYIIINNINKIT